MRVTAETKSATRQRILESSQTLFVDQGFEAATTRDIARAAGIAVGTLFNYFPTKEAVAQCLVAEAYARAAEKFASQLEQPVELSLEEELFAHVAATLRQLKPFRKYLTAVLDAELFPPLSDRNGDAPPLRTAHLEVVGQIASRHGAEPLLSTLALHLYWTLLVGVLVFWSNDRSPRQEDTLALLDESLAMFCGWLAAQSHSGR